MFLACAHIIMHNVSRPLLVNRCKLCRLPQLWKFAATMLLFTSAVVTGAAAFSNLALILSAHNAVVYECCDGMRRCLQQLTLLI